MIRFHCPQCRAPLTAGDDAALRSGQCNRCQGTLTVPARSVLTRPAPPGPEPEEEEESRGPGVRPARVFQAIIWCAAVALLVLAANAFWVALFVTRHETIFQQMRDFLAAATGTVLVYCLARALDRLTR